MATSEGGFTIVSWNINGMRTLDMKKVLEVDLNFGCTILGVQETKLSRNQLEEAQALVNNYSSYFSFSKNRAGYSGVALYCQNEMTPSKAEEGVSGLMLDMKHKESEWAIGGYCNLQDEDLSDAKYGDCDGRSIITQHIVHTPDGEEKKLNVINVYCPRLRDDPADQINNKQFKLTFHNLLAERAKNLAKAGEFVLMIGDFNVCHTIIDQSDIEDPKLFRITEFREWLDELLSNGFKDTFRAKHPTREKAFTCWCTKLNARENNYGARIDFILADDELMKYLKDSEVHSNIMGSDHCPISASFHSLIPKQEQKLPPLATKFFPEYAGKQQKLTDLFLKQQERQSPILMTERKFISQTNVSGIKRKADTKLNSKKSGKQTSLASFFVKKESVVVQEKSDKNVGEFTNSDDSFTPPQSEGVSSETPVPQSSSFPQVNTAASQKWRQLMKAPTTPLCDGHKVACVLRTVKKKGPHQGRQFWSCSKGSGRPDDPNATCNFFLWANATKY